MEASKRRKRKNIIFAVLAVLAVILMVAIPFLLEARQKNAETGASILSAQAETGTIRKTLSGTGTLTEQDAEDVSVPQGVQVTEYLVSNGQYVKTGEPVAVADKISVMETISAVRESMTEIETELETLRSGSDYTYLTAPASGKVKAVYAKAGDSVQDVMLQHGTLAVLSLDGLMCVRFPDGGVLSAGQTVTVQLSEGTTVAGRVETVIEGEATVTFSDEYGSIGERVTVQNEAGQQLGSGELEVHSAWNAVASGGTVYQVYAVEGRTVSIYGTVLVLNGTSTIGNYDQLLSEHQDYEDMMADLFRMYQDGYLTAPCDGCVSGADDDILEQLSADEASEPVLKLLANAPGENPDGSFDNVIGIVTDSSGSAVFQKWTTEIEDYTNTSFIVTAADSFTKKYSGNFSTAYQWATGYTYSSVTGENVETINTENGENTFLRAGTYYVQKEDGSYEETAVESGTVEVTVTEESIAGSETGTVYYNRTEDSGWSQVSIAVGGIYAFAFDDSDSLVFMVYLGYSDELPETSEKGSGSGNSGKKTSSGTGGGSSTGKSSASTETETALYATDRTTILSVTPQEKITVSITVDELDILYVRKGQEAAVTLDALPGQAFSGMITEVNTTASNEGGNSKYSAVVEMDRNGYMLSGMNASANITIEEREGALLIPSEALFEKNGQAYVYTAYDSSTETLSAAAVVETGLSDGLQVQILSGLQAGDTVWYSYYDTLEISGFPGLLPNP